MKSKNIIIVAILIIVLLSSCGYEENYKSVNSSVNIKKDLFKYKNISYGRLKNLYPDAEGICYWSNKFSIEIKNENIIIIAYDTEYMVKHDLPVLSDDVICDHIAANLSDLLDGNIESMSIADFIDMLSTDGSNYPEYSVVTTVGTNYYFSNKYIYIKLDCDKNGTYDTALYIDVSDQEDNFVVESSSRAALYLNYLPEEYY